MIAEQTVSQASVYVDLIFKVGPVVGAFFVLGIVGWRTRSFHYLVVRLFQTLGATRSFHSKTAERQWRAYEDWQQHNLWHGLRLKTSRHLASLQTWLDLSDITIEEACRAGRFFDANALILKRPKTGAVLAEKLVSFVFAMVLISVFCLFMGYDEALLTVKKTDTRFWVEQGQASGFASRFAGIFSVETWRIDTEYCLFSDEIAPLKNEWDRDVICRLVLGNEQPYLRDTVWSQNFLAWTLGIVAIVLLWRIWVVLRSETQVSELRARLELDN